jgi:light-regulated signal transduction histidine kinase (bacteriophytochrome)
VHPDDLQNYIRVFDEAFHEKKPFVIEYRLRRYDGEYRWILARAKPNFTPEGLFTGYIGTCVDIHEQRMHKQDLEQHVEQRTHALLEVNLELERSNSELEQFAYVASHDLQEPLRKIQTFCSRIAETDEKNLSQSGKDYFDRIQQSAHRMQKLIVDLLAYSRTTNEEGVLQVADIGKLVDEIKAEMKEQLLEKQAEITVQGPCEMHLISFQIKQLLQNLISNSLKFSKKDTAPRIDIRCSLIEGSSNPDLIPDKRYCHISITDNGIGFAPEYRQRIFEVFQRLHARHEYEGTGIGLAIVKRIVENHGGLITANGTPGEGARFDIYLPQ